MLPRPIPMKINQQLSSDFSPVRSHGGYSTDADLLSLCASSPFQVKPSSEAERRRLTLGPTWPPSRCQKERR